MERELADSRHKAQALVLAGKVLVDGQRSDKPGRAVTAENRIAVEQPLRYVSRGGIKLEAAIRYFNIGVAGSVCLDVGSSTGGFADCLLQHEALRVHAVDTGAGQIDWKLRTDDRVILHEHTNARYLTFGQIGECPSVITCDVSFISVTLLIPVLAPLLAQDGDWITLVKPQFEVGRDLVGKGGIVRDPTLQRSACLKVANAFEAIGFATAMMDSPILGAKGNREFLLHSRSKS